MASFLAIENPHLPYHDPTPSLRLDAPSRSCLHLTSFALEMVLRVSMAASNTEEVALVALADKREVKHLLRNSSASGRPSGCWDYSA